MPKAVLDTISLIEKEIHQDLKIEETSSGLTITVPRQVEGYTLQPMLSKRIDFSIRPNKNTLDIYVHF